MVEQEHLTASQISKSGTEKISLCCPQECVFLFCFSPQWNYFILLVRFIFTRSFLKLGAAFIYFSNIKKRWGKTGNVQANQTASEDLMKHHSVNIEISQIK